MSDQYEHGGVIYHEPLPRILLVNFPIAQGVLRTRGHNVKSCRFDLDTYHYQFNLLTPSPPHEVDILLVRDAPVEGMEKDASGKERVAKYYSAGTIKWPSSYQDSLSGFCSKILRHGGICVIFVSPHNGNLLKHANLGITVVDSHCLWPKRSAHTFPDAPDSLSLSKFVSTFFDIPKVCVGLRVTPEVLPCSAPLILDTAQVPYALVVHPPTEDEVGIIICFPDYGDSLDVLNELLAETLPEFMPGLFPFRRNMSWLKEPEFTHPNVLSLRLEQQAIQEETQRKLDVLNTKIRAIEDEEQFLRDLIVSAGDPLKVAVKRTLEQLFSVAGVTDALVLDVDSDPALRNGFSEKREDLRIEWGGEIFLLNVAGREQYFKQDSINQLDKHRRLFLKANPAALLTKVHSVLVANFNYASGSDPRKRGQIFGTGTAQAKQRLLDAGHGAISTYDLYRLLRIVQRNQAIVMATDLRKLLCAQGILDFEEFSAGLGKGPSPPPPQAIDIAASQYTDSPRQRSQTGL